MSLLKKSTQKITDSQTSEKDEKKQDSNTDSSTNNNGPAIVRRESNPGFWHGATREDCQNAEDDLVRAFVNLKKFSFESKDIILPKFDPRPPRIIEKERKQALSSFSFANLFSWGGNDTTNDTTNNNTSATTHTSNGTSINCRRNSNTTDQKSKFETKDDASNLTTATTVANVDLKTSNENENENENKEDDNNQIPKSKSMFTLSTTTQNETESKNETKTKTTEKTNKKELIKPEFIHTLSFSPQNAKFLENSDNSKNSTDNATEEKSNNNDKNTENLDDDSDTAPIILAHGYGCGGAVFVPSIEPLYCELKKHNPDGNKSRKIHLIDWLGCGLSSRAKFECDDVDECEEFFVESFEEWRRVMGIKRMILVGHSLGGYMSAVYALKYPQFIDHLILISPVGVPEVPSDYGNMDKYPWKTRMLISTFRSLWDKGFTPHDLVRWVGPKGKSLVEGAVNRRLFRLDDTERGKKLKPLLAEYLYHITHDGGSGEYALNKVLMPGAFAYKPLYSRLPGLSKYQSKIESEIYCGGGVDIIDKNDEVRESKESKENENVNGDVNVNDNVNVLNDNLKVDFIYGESDWMDDFSAKELKKTKALKCNVYQIDNAGHQLLLENSDLFAQKLAAIISDAES